VITAWSQWGDLDIPAGVRLRTGPLDTDLDQITFYAPRYTGAALELDHVPAMSALSVLQLPNAGYEDALAFARDGLTICNAKGVHDASTAELAITLTLASLRGIPEFVRAQSAGEWVHHKRQALADSRVAVIGHGSIGQRIVRLLQSLEADVTAFSKRGIHPALPITDLDAALSSFDVVILIAPATAETHHLFNEKRLRLLRDGALLVNVSRGSLIDTDALVAELSIGRISAALDVTEPEPLPPHHPLWSMPNCLISPHVGGDTSAFEPRMRRLITDQLHRLVAGEELLNVVG
jgi:phosphoglycerate dehydrogenase-like enzyme